MRPYSQDLRERVVAACDQGQLTREEIAEPFAVSTSWIRRLLQRRRDTGSFAALPQRPGRKPKVAGAGAQRLATLVAEQPDATLDELRQRLRIAISLGALAQALLRLGLTRKKSRCGPASRTGPTCSSSGPPGGRRCRRSIPRAGSSWTSRGRTRP